MIDSFRGEWEFLSNFYPLGIELDLGDGVPPVKCPTVEHAFQAAKTLDHAARLRVASMPGPAAAKREGRRVRLRDDWQQVKGSIMEQLVECKFRTHADLADRLLATGEEELVEGNAWGDRVWGCVRQGGRWVGENRLGQILMRVRERLRDERNSR